MQENPETPATTTIAPFTRLFLAIRAISFPPVFFRALREISRRPQTLPNSRSVISWRKISLGFFAALFASALPLFAQPAPQKPDPRGVRDSLATAEAQHREAYEASKFADAIAAARGGLALAERAGTIADKV